MIRKSYTTQQQQPTQNPKQDRMIEGVCPMARSKPLIPRSTRMMALRKFKNFGRDLMDSRPGHLSANSTQPVRTSKATAPILRLPNDAENTVRKAGETYLTSGDTDQLRVKRNQFQQGLAANSFELNPITPALIENPHPILKTRSTDSAKEILLSVPARLAPLAKRRSTPGEELPLDSRIRRVSMILMSRHTLPYTDSRIHIVEPKSRMGSGNSLKDDTTLNPALTTSSPGWKYNGVVRQDTDNWSLLSAPKGESPTSLPKRSPEVTFPQMASLDSCAGRREINLRKNKKARRPTDRFSKGIGYHLGRRRHLLERRRRMADFALAFGIFGILAALLDTESIACGWYKQTSVYSLTVRILISLSTVVLMTLIISYHAYDVMIFLCEEYIKDWRISVTKRRVLQVTLELLICSIHPLPGINLFFELPSRPLQNITVLHPIRKEVGSSNLMGKFSPYLLLVLPMIARLYLAFRTLLLHSKMFNDAGSRSIGSMNKVSFDLRFVLKTMMTLCPLKSLLVFICVIWIILSWMLRACELIQMESQLSPLNSAWLISVTFLSIGYGDIVPHTHCGRLVAVITGLMGSACTALLVAVFSRKLELSKAEKHVLHFMEANEITKRVKHCAANVLRETWLLYKNARLMPTINPKRVRVHQRRFLQAIYSLRKIKVKQREMQDKSDSLVDLAKLQTNVFEGVADISLRQDSFQSQLKCIEHQLLEIKRLLVEERRTEKPCFSHHLVNAATGSRDHRRLSADNQLRTISHDSS